MSVKTPEYARKPYHRLPVQAWERICKWDVDAVVLAGHLCFSRHRNTEGLFKLPLAYVAADLGWSMERVEAAANYLDEHAFALFDGGYVLLLDALEWQPPGNRNAVKGAVRKVAERCPDAPRHLLSTLLRQAEQFAPDFGEALAELVDCDSEYDDTVPF